MSNFLQPDKYAHIKDGVYNGLQKRLNRSEGDDLQRVHDYYVTDVKQRMIDSGLYSYNDVATLTIYDDGTASGQGVKYSGAPSYAEFTAYIEKGRIKILTAPSTEHTVNVTLAITLGLIRDLMHAESMEFSDKDVDSVYHEGRTDAYIALSRRLHSEYLIEDVIKGVSKYVDVIGTQERTD